MSLIPLRDEVIQAVDPVDFHRSLDYPDWSGKENDLVQCPKTEAHEAGDEHPSLCIQPETGQFICYGCGWKGTSVLAYYTDQYCSGNFRKAVKKLFGQYIRPLISSEQIEQWHDNLLVRPKLLYRLAAKRGWSKDTVRKLKLGWHPDKKRIVIPVFNYSGLCIDVKFHDSLKIAPRIRGKRCSVLSLKGGKTGDAYPMSLEHNPLSADKNELWIVEGEPDAILATQDGMNCITATGGAKALLRLSRATLEGMRGKKIYILLDSDKTGEETAKALSEQLASINIKSLKNISLPSGKDLTDYFLEHGGSMDQLQQIATTYPYLIAPRNVVKSVVPLSDTSKPEFIGKTVMSEVLVNGKHHSPLAIPKTVQFSCTSPDRCTKCPCSTTGNHTYEILPNTMDIVEWVYSKDWSNQIRKELGLSPRCKMVVQVEEWQSMEKISMIPALSIKQSSYKNGFVSRQGYYLGHGLESNSHYQVKAIPSVHPRTKESILLVEEAKGSHDAISGFELEADEVEHLKSVFNDPPAKTISNVCKMLSTNHTKIYGRPELHAAIDLCFHSPMSFTFSGVEVPKGSMELLLLGDTRCGKGQAAEKIIEYYDLGTVVSGENSSFMGLVGGAQKTDSGFQLVWGRIPTNHGRLVVVDEFSSFQELPRLSRVRSEGRAEIDKGGIHASTGANTRLIWIANPRKGRAVAQFSSGVQAIMDLIKAAEDVARFDLALVVAKGEVSIEKINRENASNSVSSKYTRQDLRKVILWVWSRRSEHVLFSREASSAILSGANELAGRYSSTIPLIQGENARFKIAKIAVAVAGRCFSTEDGHFLNVRERHVKAAIGFIKRCYDKPVMGYLDYSKVEIETDTLINVGDLEELFDNQPAFRRSIMIDGMLSSDNFGVREMQDWTDTDTNIAKKFIGTLVRCQAIRLAARGLYSKKPKFIYYLKERKNSG